MAQKGKKAVHDYHMNESLDSRTPKADNSFTYRFKTSYQSSINPDFENIHFTINKKSCSATLHKDIIEFITKASQKRNLTIDKYIEGLLYNSDVRTYCMSNSEYFRFFLSLEFFRIKNE